MMDINLLPWRDYQKKKEKRRQALELIAAGLLSLALVSGLHVCLSQALAATQERLSQMQAHLTTMNKQLDTLREFYQAIDYQKVPEMDLQLILARQQRLLAFLQALAEQTPASVSLRELRFEKNNWQLQGLARDLSALLHYSDELRSLLQFKKQAALDIREEEGLFYFKWRAEAVE